ncbi:MAG TPA: tetratricopeptide repeat protein [Thermoanaerobaculia bacterium]|nr:tetratricopeptide repeat protein [Thermoanaerobaculia bacterium]
MPSAAGERSPVDQGLFLLHLNRARRSVRSGSFEDAWAELEQARSLRPEDEDVLNLVSLLEYKRGRYDEAAAAARVLLERNASSEVLRSNLGLILFKAGRLADAERELRAAIDQAPGHLRSHLYLGLLYQSRGKLGLALEHLRVAGAKRRVAEIEESLKRPTREAAPRPSANLSDTAPTRPSPSASAGPERSEFEPAFPDASEAVLAAAPPTAIAATPSGAEGRPLFKVRPDGSLEVASRGNVFVRKGCVAWYSGKIQFRLEPSFRGTSLERILRCAGMGTLLVTDPGRRAYRRELNGTALVVEGSRLLALDHGLTFRLEAIQDFRRNRRVDLLRVTGRGSVVFSVAGPVLSHDVSPEFPLSISSRDLVGWTGELVASVLDDRFLEEVMQPDIASPPKIRFEGEGVVFTEPPRPRRRSSDIGRALDQRRN